MRSMRMLILLLLAAPFAAAGETGAALPAPLPEAGNAGRLVAGAGSRAFCETGAFFTRAGKAVGKESAHLFVGQGRFWKRTANSLFADFREAPPSGPLRPDQM